MLIPTVRPKAWVSRGVWSPLASPTIKFDERLCVPDERPRPYHSTLPLFLATRAAESKELHSVVLGLLLRTILLHCWAHNINQMFIFFSHCVCVPLSEHHLTCSACPCFLRVRWIGSSSVWDDLDHPRGRVSQARLVPRMITQTSSEGCEHKKIQAKPTRRMNKKISRSPTAGQNGRTSTPKRQQANNCQAVRPLTKNPVQAHMKDFFSEALQKKMMFASCVSSVETATIRSRKELQITSRALSHHCCALRLFMFLHRLVFTEQKHLFPPTSVAHKIRCNFPMPGGDWGQHQHLTEMAEKHKTNIYHKATSSQPPAQGTTIEKPNPARCGCAPYGILSCTEIWDFGAHEVR